MKAQLLSGLALAGIALAHGDHGKPQKPIVAPDANWMVKHMAEEHHMEYWDPDSFFGLHDYNSDNIWTTDEILRTYGLMDESNKEIPVPRRKEIEKTLLDLLDRDGNGEVSRDEFTFFMQSGKTLPDLGTGPGHHGDDEYEYEIHHWEKYHDENTKLEDLVHPEDIEHFKKHEEREDAEERLEELEKLSIVDENIPAKFRRGSS